MNGEKSKAALLPSLPELLGNLMKTPRRSEPEPKAYSPDMQDIFEKTKELFLGTKQGVKESPRVAQDNGVARLPTLEEMRANSA